MKRIITSFCFLVLITSTYSQELHNEANAVSVINESNAVAGWTSLANLTVDSQSPQQGQYSFRISSTGSSGREINYTFPTISGRTYTIRIWARRGDQFFSPAFANWTGFTGFSTTSITTSTWREYSWNLQATGTSATIRVFTSPRTGGTTGDTVYIDAVSITSPDTQAPSAITDLTATNITDSALDLSWSAASDNVGVTGYQLFMNGNSLGSTSGATTFHVANLTPATQYSFTVQASDAAGNISGNSNVLQVMTTSATDTEPPTQVTGIQLSNITSSGATLTWNPSSDNVGVMHYLIFLDNTYNSMVMSGTSFDLSNLDADTAYQVTMYAEDMAGNRSVVSNTLQLRTLPDTMPPTVPQGLSASNTTQTGTTLNWQASVDDHAIDHYMVFQDGIMLGSTAQLNYQVNNLNPATTYNFTIMAMDAAGNGSALSAPLQVTTSGTQGDTEPPGAVTDLHANSITSFSVQLQWSAVSDNVGVSMYHVFQNGSEIGQPTATSFLAEGLNPGSTYQFMIMAMDAAGNMSSMGNMINVTTLSEVAVVDYTSENSNLPSVDWNANNLWVNGNLGIGTNNTMGYRLAVAGKVVAEEVKVALQGNWPDYVFKEDYPLPSLTEVKHYIALNGHLMDIPKDIDIQNNGISLGQMNALLLRKIEELTLYLIQQEEKQQILSSKLAEYEALKARLEVLENKLSKSQD